MELWHWRWLSHLTIQIKSEYMNHGNYTDNLLSTVLQVLLMTHGDLLQVVKKRVRLMNDGLW